MAKEINPCFFIFSFPKFVRNISISSDWGPFMLKSGKYALALFSLGISNSSFACDTIYYVITIDPISATETKVGHVVAGAGGFKSVIARDERDRKRLSQDTSISAADKAKMIMWLDANIRNARCWQVSLNAD